MGSAGNDGTRLAVDQLGDDHLGEGDGAADLFGGALNLNLVALAGRREVAHVDVDRDARLVPQVPRGNGHAAGPVDNGGRDAAVDAAARVDVVLGQPQPRLDVALRRRVDPHVGQEKVVDGRAGQVLGHQALNVGFDGVVVDRHDCENSGI